MSRKHFREFAKWAAECQLTDAQVDSLMNMLAVHNDRFSRGTFQDAVECHRMEMLEDESV